MGGKRNNMRNIYIYKESQFETKLSFGKAIISSLHHQYTVEKLVE